MKKKAMKYALAGAPCGLALYVLFLLWSSWLRGDGEFHVGYYLVRIYGTEMNAMLAASICAMALGMLWAGASLIFWTDWSLLKQTVIHYLVCTVPSLVIAWGAYFIPRGTDGPMQYLCLFGVLYAVNWAGQYLSLRKRVRQMNRMLETRK